MVDKKEKSWGDYFYALKLWFLVTAYEIVGTIFGVGMPPLSSVAAVIKKKDKILAIKLTYKDGLALPGGALKGDESFEEALKREVKEETNLSVTRLEYFGSYSSYSSRKKHPKVSVVYTVEAKGKARRSAEGEVVWVDPKKNLDDFYYEDNKKALKDYLKNE